MKKIFWKFIMFLFMLLPWVILGLLLAVLFFGPYEYEERRYFQENGVEVTAHVTRIKRIESEDTDGYTDVDYKVYVSYTYDGEDYEDVFLQNQSSRPTSGSSRTIIVDPADPDHIHTADLSGGMWFVAGMGLLYTVFLVFFAGFLAFFRVDKKWSVSAFYQNAVLRVGDVQKELTTRSQKCHKLTLCIMALGGVPMAVAGVWALVKYGQILTLGVYGLIYLVTMVSGLPVCRWLTKRNAKKCTAVQLKPDVVLRRYTEEDSDYNTQNMVEFSDGVRWRVNGLCLVSRSGKGDVDFLPDTPVILATDEKNKILRVFYGPEYILAG